MLRLATLSLVLTGGFLGGCNLKDRLDSPEDRINAVMPLSIDVRQARERLLDQLAEKPTERKASDTEWAARLRLRAVTCSRGLQISWRQSNEELRSALTDKTCFTVRDRQLQRWVNVQRMRQLLMLPTVASSTPVPNSPLSLPLPSPETSAIKDLGRSPAMALKGMTALEIVSLDSGRSLFKEQPNRAASVSVSPNGRLFAEIATDTIRVRVIESGDTLLELPEADGLFWLGTKYLAVHSARHNKPSYVIDLNSSEEVPLPLKAFVPGFQILPVPGNEQRLNILSFRGIQQFEIHAVNGQTGVVSVAEKSTAGGLKLAPENVRLSAGDKEWVMNGEALIRVDPVSLEIRETSFAPIGLVSASPTASPDQYVVQLRAHGSANSGNGNYVFDAKQETLARVHGLAAERAVRYFPAVNRYALLSYQQIELIDALETAAPHPAVEVIGAMLEESNQHRLKEAEADMRRVLQNAALLPDSPLLARMQMAQVEGLGVYEAQQKTAMPGMDRRAGNVMVTVRRSSRPLVLVLRSYEPVQWKLRLEQGARLEAILLSSYYDSTVEGGGDVRVLRIGKEYAYQSEGSEYQALQRAVTRWTGKPVGIFQGGYRVGSFSVGGN